MTLVEKLRQNLTGHLSDEKSEVDVRIAEAIAEEFAIGFAEWLGKLVPIFGSEYVNNSTKELLEIYKKEKGL